MATRRRGQKKKKKKNRHAPDDTCNTIKAGMEPSLCHHEVVRGESRFKWAACCGFNLERRLESTTEGRKKNKTTGKTKKKKRKKGKQITATPQLTRALPWRKRRRGWLRCRLLFGRRFPQNPAVVWNTGPPSGRRIPSPRLWRCSLRLRNCSTKEKKCRIKRNNRKKMI